ncbi:TIGR01841 family phasin [Aminobacter sp. P9b]|uniref:Phasin family protein n=1 Tax=Aminobacter niigataensis TaxID=83265 RepID=A0ABR6KWX9_9HYPH|nr:MULTISPECIES: TIGR01841 family phasin [Aminobacter]AWC23607.1 phasin family protein [Aminobacter sp. MSH1]MBB4648987.1 phasin family protein [Aminobacter niigataensis]CAI2934280.1 Phasin family protein [Aminobacter niigataensis]
MAKKPEPESFMDMFSKFGRDLKMPAVDVDDIVSHHRKNLEALEKSVKASASGASSLVAKQREMIQSALQEVTEAAQGLRMPGNPQEMLSKQADFARRSFEAALKNAGEVADIVRKSGSESVEVLRERIRESMQEIRDSYDKKK